MVVCIVSYACVLRSLQPSIIAAWCKCPCYMVADRTVHPPTRTACLPSAPQAAQQHLQCIKQFQRQRRSSAAGAGAEAAAASAPADAGLATQEASGPAAPDMQQPETATLPPKRKRQLFPMQINLVADDVALRFEHHPLEVRVVCGWTALQLVAGPSCLMHCLLSLKYQSPCAEAGGIAPAPAGLAGIPGPIAAADGHAAAPVGRGGGGCAGASKGGQASEDCLSRVWTGIATILLPRMP